MKRSKKKLQQKIEQQDVLGISRKKWNHTIPLEVFVALKFVCIILIPIVYFVYSPLLVVCMFAYVGLFFLSIMAERGMNKSVIKSNHIKIPKMDSALALIVIVIAFFGVCMGGTAKVKTPNFSNTAQIGNFKEIDFGGIRKDSWWRDFKSSLTNFGSLLTGERSIFGSGKKDFGMMKPPADFISDMGDIPNMPSNGEGRPSMPKFDFNIDDLPVEYMFSSIISTVNTAIIFSVSISGMISLFVLAYKCKKFNKLMKEVIVTENVFLTEQEIDKILDFGELVCEKQTNDDDLDFNREDNTETISNPNQPNYLPIQTEDDNSIEDNTRLEEKEDIEILNENFDIDKIYD